MADPLADAQWPLPAAGPLSAFAHLERWREPVEDHRHPDAQLVVPVRGAVRFRAGGREERVAPPEALLLWPGLAHAMLRPAGPAELVTLQLTERALRSAAELAGAALARPPSGMQRVALGGGLLRELVYALAAPGEPGAYEAQVYRLLCLALVRRLAGAGGGGPQHFRSEHVERAVQWLRDNPGSAVRAGELARRVGTSPRNLARAFRAELGTSPARYALRLRLEAAALALESTPRSAKEVAAAAGFASVPHFTRAFRKAFGVSPLEHRRRARGGP